MYFIKFNCFKELFNGQRTVEYKWFCGSWLLYGAINVLIDNQYSKSPRRIDVKAYIIDSPESDIALNHLSCFGGLSSKYLRDFGHPLHWQKKKRLYLWKVMCVWGDYGVLWKVLVASLMVWGGGVAFNLFQVSLS